MKKAIQNFKDKINLENILCMFIIICPILDMISFIFRNYFNVNWSPSTFIRPIIPIIVIIYIFFKDKIKLKLFTTASIYGIYAIIHLYLFQTIKTQSSYSGVVHELQYIINYSFMVLNLFIYIYVFLKKDTNKLKISILISNTIYIISIFISIITKTSSSTYIEGIGYKGWFESGNSISSILILSMFIILDLIKQKKYRNWALIVTVLVGIFLTTLIGTRVGLFGFILVLFIYATTELLVAILHRVQLNKNILIGSLCAIVGVVIVVGIVGSSTLQRRKHLHDIEANIVDETTKQEAHISGSLLEIKEKIEKGELKDEYMSEASKKSILDLYNFANKYNITNNDMRKQQLIYNTYLVKNQANPILILCGNGYMANYRELVLEMEIPAFLFNFGICGFILYFVPFLTIFIYASYKALKNIKRLDTQYILLLVAIFLSFAFAFLSGYTFFNSSTMMIIITLNVLLINKIYDIGKGEK